MKLKRAPSNLMLPSTGRLRYFMATVSCSQCRTYIIAVTKLEVDGIVNAANERCLGGGGSKCNIVFCIKTIFLTVDGAIHSAAGNLLYEGWFEK